MSNNLIMGDNLFNTLPDKQRKKIVKKMSGINYYIACIRTYFHIKKIKRKRNKILKGVLK